MLMQKNFKQNFNEKKIFKLFYCSYFISEKNKQNIREIVYYILYAHKKQLKSKLFTKCKKQQ